LTCHLDNYDIATDLKIAIEEQLAFKVTIYAEDCDEYNEKYKTSDDDSLFSETDLEADFEGTTVLLVFRLNKSLQISAWVTIEDEDERSFFESKYKESLFPDTILFDRKDFSGGMRILKYILVSKFGLVVRNSRDELLRELFGIDMDQPLRSGRDHQEETEEAIKPSGKRRWMRRFRKKQQ